MNAPTKHEVYQKLSPFEKTVLIQIAKTHAAASVSAQIVAEHFEISDDDLKKRLETSMDAAIEGFLSELVEEERKRAAST